MAYEHCINCSLLKTICYCIVVADDIEILLQIIYLFAIIPIVRAYVPINVRDAIECERACAILENRSFNIAKNKRLTVML